MAPMHTTAVTNKVTIPAVIVIGKDGTHTSQYTGYTDTWHDEEFYQKKYNRAYNKQDNDKDVHNGSQ